MPEMPPATLLTALGTYNLLPAIVFLPTRRRCDQAAAEAALMRRDPNAGRRDARREFMKQFVSDHDEVRTHRHWDSIVRGAVASHHAGHIPAWKLLIENLMSAGLLDAIFATATVAAGVDFPARTVVLTGADARTASGWRALSASELQQMTGRAGRRGRDRVGFIVAAPGIHQDPQRIVDLLRAKPDPLVSQFRATYSTLLNLLDAYRNFAQVRQIAERSFAYRELAKQIIRLEAEHAAAETRIRDKLATANGELSMADALGLERLLSARERLQQMQPQTRGEVLLHWLDKVVKPGRVVGIGRSGKRLIMVTHRRDGNVLGVREDGRRVSLSLQRVGRVYEPTYPLRDEAIEAAFEEIQLRGKDVVLAEPRLRDVREEETGALELIDKLVTSLTREGPDHDRCMETLWSTLPDAGAALQAMRQRDVLREEVWLPFEKRARVLAKFGYLDFESEKVTERGRWLADLHVDRPLLIGEALERGLFASITSVQLAAVLGALTADEDRDYGELELDDTVVTTLGQFEEIGFAVATEEWEQGIEPAPDLNFSAAGAAARWASGMSWSTLVQQTRAEEGDLFRMLSRTGEALLQVAGLKKAHPQASQIAWVAAETVLRDPVR